MLYKSNVLLYDRETESLWSQVKREAVTGPLMGTRLYPIPSTLTKWKRWKKRHPKTLVLSIKTGYLRDYSRDPYESYYKSPSSFFSFNKKVPQLPEKELVLGIEINGKRKAYPLDTLRGLKTPLKDTVAGATVTLHADEETGDLYALGPEGKRVEGIITYWFVWYDFYPETLVYKE